MTTVSFKAWTEQNPDWKNELGVYQRDSSTYQRLPCLFKTDSKVHAYHGVINVNNGDIYLDCRKRKIAAKHFVLLILRPFHACVKTLWHASIIGPLAFEIFACLKKGQSVKTLAIHMVQSIADIIRTPLYSVAMVIVHLAALVLGALAPRTLYHTRSAAGFLERKMLRQKEVWRSPWKLSPCFSPVSKIKPTDPIARVKDNLDGFAKNQIKFRQEFAALFNDCGHKLPPSATYVSAAARKLVESKVAVPFLTHLEAPVMDRVYLKGQGYLEPMSLRGKNRFQTVLSQKLTAPSA